MGNNIARKNYGSRMIGAIRNWRNNSALPFISGGNWGRPLDETERYQPVYDIINCGDRNQFVVRPPGGGEPFIVHNCTQATARDILTEALLRLDKAGYDVRGHVHDEVLILAKEGDDPEDVTRLMAETPSWATGLPTASDTYTCQRYRKE